MDYVGLANNHVLDFGVQGMEETVRVVGNAGLKWAGAGVDEEEARRPAVLHLLRQDGGEYNIHVWAASDHPREWGRIPGFHLIDYTSSTRDRLKKLSTRSSDEGNPADLKIFSIHWGPNYTWHPSPEIRSVAHFLIDSCSIDIIHGHSSHHVQGVEVYHNKLIIYGCGDFIDDYAVNTEYRNDLGAVRRVVVAEEEGGGLKVRRLEVVPTRIERFQARVAEMGSEEYEWVCGKVGQLSLELGTGVEEMRGEQGQLIVPVS